MDQLQEEVVHETPSDYLQNCPPLPVDRISRVPATETSEQGIDRNEDFSSNSVGPQMTTGVEPMDYLSKPARGLPASIIAVVDFGPDKPAKRVNVLISVEKMKAKTFLGGFRDRKTGAEYHHSSMQTDPKPLSEEQIENFKVPKFHRDSQTVYTVTRSTRTVRESATQMSKPGLFVSEQTDIVLHPRPYFTADELDKLRLQKIIKLQCHIRGWYARRLMRANRREWEEAKTRAAHEEAERKAREESQGKREMDRRMHPRSEKDFALLLTELEAWRLQETKKINANGLPEVERLAALAQLLHKETKLLQTIDQLKIQAGIENRERRIHNTMDMMASPKVWPNFDGKTTEVDTPFTVRARELRELYHGLITTGLSMEDRLDVLLHVKWSTKEFDCPLTRELIELVDREADLLNRGRTSRSLEGLRVRIANLFLQFCESPEFNPEAARFQKVPQEFYSHPNIKQFA